MTELSNRFKKWNKKKWKKKKKELSGIVKHVTKQSTTKKFRPDESLETSEQVKEQNTETLINAKKLSAKKINYKKEDVALRIQLGESIPEIPESAVRVAQPFFKQKTHHGTLI